MEKFERDPQFNKANSIAFCCHEANRAWCIENGDHSQQPWDEAEDWQQVSGIKGVLFRLNNPNAPDSTQHDAWMKDKLDAGWEFGYEKDGDKKTHPCLVPFQELPEFQQKKDKLFCAIVDALK